MIVIVMVMVMAMVMVVVMVLLLLLLLLLTTMTATATLLLQDKTRIDAEMMPDGLHPGRAGSVKWADCLLPTLKELDPRWGNWGSRPDDVDIAVPAPGAAAVAPEGHGASSGAVGGGNSSKQNPEP